MICASSSFTSDSMRISHRSTSQRFKSQSRAAFSSGGKSRLVQQIFVGMKMKMRSRLTSTVPSKTEITSISQNASWRLPSWNPVSSFGPWSWTEAQVSSLLKALESRPSIRSYSTLLEAATLTYRLQWTSLAPMGTPAGLALFITLIQKATSTYRPSEA